MTMSDVADKINKVSNRTATIVIASVIMTTATAVATYYGVTGAIKDFRTEYRYDRKLQGIRDSLQDRHVEEIRLAKYP